MRNLGILMPPSPGRASPTDDSGMRVSVEMLRPSPERPTGCCATAGVKCGKSGMSARSQCASMTRMGHDLLHPAKAHRGEHIAVLSPSFAAAGAFPAVHEQ